MSSLGEAVAANLGDAGIASPGDTAIASPGDAGIAPSPPNPTAASLLGLLSGSAMTGWELYARFKGSIGYFWSITRSQVYRELRTLAADGLIEIGASGARERRICTITPLGRAAFTRWIAEPPGDELIRFPLLLMTFFGASVPPERLTQACMEQRRKHAARLGGYEELLPKVATAEPFPALALQFGISYERAVLAWIDGLPMMTAPAAAPTPAARQTPEAAQEPSDGTN